MAAGFVGQILDQVRRAIGQGSRNIALIAALGLAPELLEALESQLSFDRVVQVDIPRGDDAGLVALANAATQLADLELQEQLVSPKFTWEHKLGAVKSQLDALPENSLLVVNAVQGPRLNRNDPQDALFSRRTAEALEMLSQSKSAQKIIVTPSVIPGFEPLFHLDRVSVRDALPELTKDLSAQLERLGTYPKASATWRMLAALAVADVDISRLRGEHLDKWVQYDLAKVVFDSPALRRVLVQLAILRTPVSKDILDEIGISTLAGSHQQMLDLLLVSGKKGLVLPAAISRTIQERVTQRDPYWGDPEDIEQAHQFGVAYHARRLKQALIEKNVGLAIREEMEEVHHLTELGDTEQLLARRLAFVEQYDALGKVLSQRALRFHDTPKERELRINAIRAYERAIEYDPNDAYAHHYVAYNLDFLAQDRPRIEREYRKALELEPERPWYHGRYISYLITTGRVPDAQVAWNRALEELDPNGPLFLYEEVHKHVARLLLDRGELEFAREVLDEVPASYRDQQWWQALDNLHLALDEDRDERLVFPAYIPRDERWNEPHTLAGTDTTHIADWMPGRVVDVDKKNIYLRLASPDPMGGTDIIAYRTISHDQLEKTWSTTPRDLARGAFVELLEYADGKKKIKSWPRKSALYQSDALPKILPPPDRFIRRAFAQS